MKFKANFFAILTPFLITEAFAVVYNANEIGQKSSENVYDDQFKDKGASKARTDSDKIENLSKYIDGKTYVETYKSQYIADNNGGVGVKDINERRLDKSTNQVAKVIYTKDGEMPQGYHDSTYIISSDFGKIDFKTQDLDCSDYTFDLYRNEACPAGMVMADNGVIDETKGYIGPRAFFNEKNLGNGIGRNGLYKINSPLALVEEKNGVIISNISNYNRVAANLDQYMITTNKPFDVNGGVARWWNYGRPFNKYDGWYYPYSPENSLLWHENIVKKDGTLELSQYGTSSTTMSLSNFINMTNGKARGVVSYKTLIAPKATKIKGEANLSDMQKKAACLATININDPSTYTIKDPEKYLGDNCTMECPDRPNKLITKEKEPCGVIKQDLCSLAKQFIGTDKVTLDDRKTNVCETIEVQTYNDENVSEEFPYGYTTESYQVEPAFKAGKGFYNFPAPYGKTHACDLYKREAVKDSRKVEGDCIAKQEDLKASWNAFIQKYKYIYDEYGRCITGVDTCGNGTRRGRWVLVEEEALIINAIGNGVNATSLTSKGGTVLSSGETGTAYTIKGDDGKTYGISTITQLINPVNKQVCYYTTLNVQGTTAGPRAYEIQTDSLSHQDMTAKISKTTSCLDGIIGQ